MIKKLIYMGSALVVAIVLWMIAPATPAVADTTTSEAYIPSETSITVESLMSLPERVQTNDKAKLEKLMKKCKNRKAAAKDMEESAEKLGYNENHTVILLAQEEWKNANADYKYYKKKYDAIIEKEKQAEFNKRVKVYPTAGAVWVYLKEQGFNDYVCAGIIGNMMAEVGGQTLNLKATTTGHGYYGLCQWSLRYYPTVAGKDTKGQCKFLMKNIKKTFDSYGKIYKSGFNYTKFTKLKDEKAAALAFAKCYERCGSASYAQRQKNATKAYNYFHMGD